MAIKSNRYYNDPAMAQAAANLTDLFGPPSGADESGYAAARAKDLETNQRQAMWDYMQRPDADQGLLDRAGIISDLYDPSQSYYAVDTTAATSRSNNEADNIQKSAANAADNQRALVQTLYGNLGRGDVRPALDPVIAEKFGIPAIPEQQGLPVPETETEARADILRKLTSGDTAAIGDVTMAQQALLGTDVVPTYGPDGKPVLTPRFDATGKTPVLSAEMEEGGIVRGLDETQQIQRALGTDVVQVVDDQGKLSYVNRYDAAGKTPVPGTAPTTDTFVRQDGSTFVGYADAQGQIHNQATRALEPTAVRKGEPTAGLQGLDSYVRDDGSSFVGYADASGKIHNQSGALEPRAVRKGELPASTQGAVGKPTADEARAAYVGIQARPAATRLINAYKTGALPDEADYAIQSGLDMAEEMDPGFWKFVSQQIGERYGRTRVSDAGQTFYNDVEQVMPLQLLIQSGAAVNVEEARRKRNQLMPRPSDNAQTRANRQQAMELFLQGVDQWASGKIDKVAWPDTSGLPAEPAAPATATEPAAATAPAAATTPGPNDVIEEVEIGPDGKLKRK